MNMYWIAATWVALALIASLISIRAGISVALVEILVGAVVGNIPGAEHVVQQTQFTSFLATLGSAVLTFLAGAEIDPDSLRRNWKARLGLGMVSFAAPFAGALLFARFALGWAWPAAQIAGVSLSTTSVAVVYAVMIESGLNRQEIGKLILAACFVTDLGTVLALGGLFADLNWLLAVFVAATAAAMWFMPALTRLVLRTVGGRVSEPEIKFLFLVLFSLGGLASSARSEAVLPAYLIGLVVAGVFLRDRVIVDRLRTIAFAFALLTPFFFIRAGLFISFPALVSRCRHHRPALRREDADQGRHHLAHLCPVRDAVPGPHLHHPADGDRPDVRFHRRAVRAEQPPHQPAAVQHPGDRGHPVRVRAYAHRPAVVRARPGGAGRRARGGRRRGGPGHAAPPAPSLA